MSTHTLLRMDNKLAQDELAQDPLLPRIDFSKTKPLCFVFPILLDGDLVLSPEHLGPSYLVSVLRRAGVKCHIIEVSCEGDVTEEVISEILELKPDVVGFSLTTIGVDKATRFGQGLRKVADANVFMLAGGPLATHMREKLFALDGWSFLDGLVIGEGEVPILRFAEVLATDGAFTKVPNFVYKQDGVVTATPLEAAPQNLDLIPEPARDQLELHKNRLPYVRISTSRGCTSHCTFCNAPHARNRVGPAIKGWRGRSPISAIDEVERLYRERGVNTFDFVDSTFEDPGGKARGKERVRHMAEEILRRKLKIYYNVCMQACNWTEDDRPLIRLLWESGLEKVLIGIESGSEEGLSRWEKRSTVEDNVRAVRLLREQGIYVAFGFISYHPYSTFDEIRTNNKFLHTNLGHNLRRYTVRLELYPGAEIIEHLRRDGLLHTDYDQCLNPFAYRYNDPRVQGLASALNSLYGKEYEKNASIEKDPSIFAFETYDIVLHTYFSRLSRYSLELKNTGAQDILSKSAQQADAVKSNISQFNYDLVNHYVDLAEAEELTKDIIWLRAEEIDNYYTQQIAHLKSLQLRTSMRLHRAGVRINNIQMAS